MTYVISRADEVKWPTDFDITRASRLVSHEQFHRHNIYFGLGKSLISYDAISKNIY